MNGDEKVICTICERRVTSGWIRFTDDGGTVLTICFHCIKKGLRWIMMKADAELEVDP